MNKTTDRSRIADRKFRLGLRCLPYLTAAVLLMFCCGEPVQSQVVAKRQANDTADADVTFNRDIAPMIHQRCTRCHRPGQAGPFSLITFKEVSRRAKTIEAVIASNYMPPWKPVNHEIEFTNDRRLTKKQIEQFKSWVKLGKPQGRGAAPELPTFPDGWQLGKPDLVVQMNGQFEVPASGPDVYRSFVFPLGLPEDKWIKAIEYRPTATSTVHHAIFFVDENQAARQMDGQDGKAGVEGMGFLGGAGLMPKKPGAKTEQGWFPSLNSLPFRNSPPPVSKALSRGLGAYVPGWTPNRLPGDLALLLPKGSDVVMQTHFHPSGKLEMEQGKLAIYFADRPPSKQIVPVQIPAMFGVGMGMKIPAGEKNYRLKDSFKLPVDVQLVSVGGHAHYIGRELKMTATLPDGRNMVLLKIDDWDLDWQDRYYFKELIKLPAGTVLTSELTYDNSADNPENPNHPPQEIRWGRQSGDEMGSIMVQTIAVDESQRHRLESALAEYFINSITRVDLVDLLMQLDSNRDGGLQASEAPPRLSQRFGLLDRNRDQRLGRDELSVLNRFFPKSDRRKP